MSTAAADVFLSYSRANAEAVRQVQSRLKETGLTTLLDRYALPTGQAWQPQLETALACCGTRGTSRISAKIYCSALHAILTRR